MIVTRGTDYWVYTCAHMRRLRRFSVDICNLVAVAALTKKQVVLMLVLLQALCFPVCYLIPYRANLIPQYIFKYIHSKIIL